MLLQWRVPESPLLDLIQIEGSLVVMENGVRHTNLLQRSFRRSGFLHEVHDRRHQEADQKTARRTERETADSHGQRQRQERKQR